MSDDPGHEWHASSLPKEVLWATRRDQHTAHDVYDVDGVGPEVERAHGHGGSTTCASVSRLVDGRPLAVGVRVGVVREGAPGLAANLGSMKCSACSCVKMPSVLLLESSSEAAMDVTVAHSRLPFASSSRMTRFFESCSWMRMTFSCPFTMKQ